MLQKLSVRNFAVISRVEFTPRPGLNVFTGETGAGKSVAISALGFALGADDYIVKPFSPREIVSRIRVIFRRINSLETAQEKNELQIGNTRINLSRYEVCVDGEKVVFSPKEVEILHLMSAHLNQVFTREQLLDSIWGFDFDGDSRVVDTSIKRIRKKLPEYSMLAVRSVYGVGYKIEAANA